MAQHKPTCNLFNLSEETNSWSTAIPEGLIVTQRFKKFPASYVTRIYIAIFAGGRTCQLPQWASAGNYVQTASVGERLETTCTITLAAGVKDVLQYRFVCKGAFSHV